MDEKMRPQRASEWLIALTEAPEDTDLRARLVDWIAESPDNARDWQEMTRTYEVMGMTVPVLESQWGAFAESRRQGKATPINLASIEARPQKFSKFGVYPRAMRSPKRAIASIALAACLLLIFVPNIVVRMQADDTTATAETRSLRLDDGTMIHLGPQSAVAVDYGARTRDVRLMKGEAFFEVARNPTRPFRVAARGSLTTVLGTAFNVRLLDEGVEVGVGRGHVLVDYAANDPAISEHLHAGEQLRVHWNGQQSRSTLPANQIGLRTRGELVVKDASVSEVVEAIRPWYSGWILLRGERLAQQPTTGVFRLSDPVAAVRAVADAQGAHVERITPWVLVISAR